MGSRFWCGLSRSSRRPGGDQRHSHAPFIVRTLFAPQRCRASDLMLVAQRRVGAVVAEEEDKRVFRDTERVEMIEQIAERLVHAFDQRGKRLGRCRLARVLVVIGKAGITLKGRVHRVVGQVEKERFARPGGIGDLRLASRVNASVRKVSVPWYFSMCGTALRALLVPCPKSSLP